MAVFEDGRRTAGARAKRVKRNLQMAAGDAAKAEIQARLLKSLKRNPTFKRVTIAKTIRRPLISRYRPGMEYGSHVDDALMGRSTNTNGR